MNDSPHPSILHISHRITSIEITQKSSSVEQRMKKMKKFETKIINKSLIFMNEIFFFWIKASVKANRCFLLLLLPHIMQSARSVYFIHFFLCVKRSDVKRHQFNFSSWASTRLGTQTKTYQRYPDEELQNFQWKCEKSCLKELVGIFMSKHDVLMTN